MYGQKRGDHQSLWKEDKNRQGTMLEDKMTERISDYINLHSNATIEINTIW